MGWSKLDIINLAFNKLNRTSVDDLVNAGAFADSASRGFDLLYESSITSMSWRFATKIQTLNVLITPPPIDRWLYQLQLPSDYLAVVRTWPTVNFQIYEDVIYANINQIDLEYRFLPDPTRLPATFVQYLAVLIAAWYADTVAENENLAAKLQNEAQFTLGAALFADSQSHPIPAMRNNPIVQARVGGAPDDTYYQGY